MCSFTVSSNSSAVCECYSHCSGRGGEPRCTALWSSHTGPPATGPPSHSRSRGLRIAPCGEQRNGGITPISAAWTSWMWRCCPLRASVRHAAERLAPRPGLVGVRVATSRDNGWRVAGIKKHFSFAFWSAQSVCPVLQCSKQNNNNNNKKEIKLRLWAIQKINGS